MADEFTGLKTVGSHGAYLEGELISNIPDEAVYVDNSSDLSALVDKLPVGALAIQYGFVHAWQLKPDKTWATVL